MAAESYKRYKSDEKFDVIIIGSGMSALSAASLLSRRGKKVLILERHYEPGGYTHVFKRKGYEWDVGIHYLGKMHKQTSFVAQLMNDVTSGQMKWAPMDANYDRIIFPDKSYNYLAGPENFRNQMLEYFPDEKQAIDQYLSLLKECSQTSFNFFARKALPPFLGSMLKPFMGTKFLKYSDRTVKEVLDSLTNNEKLKGVLVGQFGDYGLSPEKASFAIHAFVAGHYIDGGCFPVGGSSRICETILPSIEEAGGKLLISAEVDHVLVRNNQAIGVKMTDGREFLAKDVISSAGIINSYAHLLEENLIEKHHLKSRLKKVNPSVSHLGLYVGFQHSTEALKLEQTNLWVYPSYNHDKNVNDYLQDMSKELPVTYMSFPSTKDPDWDNRYPGRATIDLITLAPYDWFEKWKGSRWKKRGDAYEVFKEEFAQRMLSKLYEHVPQTEGKVDHYELSTPLSTEHFMNYKTGELYGIDHTPDRFRLDFLSPHTPIKNYWLTGQDILTCGVAGALSAGMITASAMLRTDLSKDVLRRVQSRES